MKRIILVTVVTLFTLSAFAQVSKEDMAIVQSVFQKNKKELVKANIKMSDTQAAVFWPIYDQYETKRVALSNERIAIVNDYLKSVSTLTGQESIALCNRVFANDKSYIDLQKSYLKKFANAIGGVNTGKFYQLETYVQEIVRLRVQDEIPFIGELSKHKH